MEVLTPDYRQIMEIVAKASGPVMAKEAADGQGGSVGDVGDRLVGAWAGLVHG